MSVNADPRLTAVVPPFRKRADVPVGDHDLPTSPERYFNREQFEADLKRIVAFYRDRGFPEARVTDLDVQLNEDQTSVRVKVTIDEGQPVVAERIAYEGFDVLPDGEVVHADPSAGNTHQLLLSAA